MPPSPILKAALGLALAVGLFLPVGHYVYTSHPVDPAERDQTAQLFAKPQDCQPETGERLTFLMGLAVVPVGIFAFSLAFRYLERRWRMPAPVSVWWVVELGCGALLVALCWYAVQEADHYHIRRSLFFRYPRGSLPLVVAALIIVLRPVGTGDAFKLVANAIALALVVMVASAEIFNEGSTGAAIGHFTAVFHPVLQVQLGKAILLDCTSQYGLYPHFLQPLFALTGLSIVRFTLVMSLLVAASYTALWVFLREAVRNRLVGLVGFLALVYATWFYHLPQDVATWVMDPYFQYNPIRLLFPAALVLLAWKYFHHPTTRRYTGITAVLAASVLWNCDSGFPTFLTWLATLCFAELFRAGLRTALPRVLRHLAAGGTILAGVIALYSAAVYVGYGAWPDYAGFLSYQKLFYVAGYAMLPMDWPGTWMVVILVYLAGLAYAARAMALRREGTRVQMVFLLSVLGLGLFAYYQGRSHPAVLALAWWPAFLLMTLFLDDLVASLRQAAGQPLTWVSTALLVWVLAGFAGAIPGSLRSVSALIRKGWSRSSAAAAAAVREEAGELQRIAGPSQEMVILSEREALLRLLAQLPSISPGSFSEMLLMQDYDDLCELLDQKPDLRVYLDKVTYQSGGCSLGIQQVLAKLRQEYDQCADTRNGLVFQKGQRLLKGSRCPLCHVHFADGPRREGLACPPVVLGRSYSLEAILKPSSAAFPRRAILSNHCRSPSYRGLVILEKQANVFQLVIGDGRRWNYYLDIPLPPDQWSYLAVVVDGEVIEAYVNGKVVAKQVAPGLVINQSPLPMVIGNLVGGDWPFEGRIKEVRILDQALPAAEVNRNYEFVVRLSE